VHCAYGHQQKRKWRQYFDRISLSIKILSVTRVRKLTWLTMVKENKNLKKVKENKNLEKGHLQLVCPTKMGQK
jgi:hypothetical protein